MTRAVIFDMDGLLVDSEVYWEQSRRDFAQSRGCSWSAADELGAKGMNSREWATLIQERCGMDAPVEEIIAGVTGRMRTLYGNRLPLLPGAIDAVKMAGGRFPLGLASSSPPEVIELVLAEMGILQDFSAIVSSDQVGRGKPNPDVFLETARHLGADPRTTVVIEDSSAGIRAAHNAGMRAIAVPNRHYPPSDEALALAYRVLPSLEHLSAEMLETG
jgi:HAD superfamily hydrolase (TIGR01509 family)